MRPNPFDKLRVKKSLGQNFLRNPDVVRDIVSAAHLAVTPPRGGMTAGENVLEVGPGEGVLTEALLSTGANVIAIEKDDRLIESLRKKFPAAKIIHGDILNSHLPFTIYDLPFKIVANIPYYITGKFLRNIFSGEHLPERVVLLLQKEVALRILGIDAKRPERSRGTKESILSISVKAYGTPSIIRYVPREDFEPVPKVDSAVLVIEKISRKFFQEVKPPLGGFTSKQVAEQKFFDLVKRGFAHKRKKLVGNLTTPGVQWTPGE